MVNSVRGPWHSQPMTPEGSSRQSLSTLVALVGLILLARAAPAQPSQYDLLLRGGHVIDAKNKISATRDIAIQDGRIAAVEPRIEPSQAVKVIEVGGLYVTPGLVDIHVHVYAGTGEKGSYAGDNSVYPDGFSFRSGVTTMVDAGSSGRRPWQSWRCFGWRREISATSTCMALA